MAAALALSACGGGSAGDGAEPAGALAEPVLSAKQAVLPSGSRQLQVLELRNAGRADAKQLQLTVAADAKLLQLALSCRGSAAARCKARADGGLDIAELRAGEMIELEQVLRLEPGFSGPTGAQWSLSHAGASAPLGTRQNLQAYSADVAVAIAAPQTSSQNGKTLLSHELTLSNKGPDEAKDLDWRLMPAAAMRWQAATCSASGGAQCPARLGEVMTVASLPKGGEIRVRAVYAARPEPNRYEPNTLSTEVRLAGDPAAGDNRVVFMPGAETWIGGSVAAQGLDGSSYDMIFDDYLRVRGAGMEREELLSVDVTGFQWITLNGKVNLDGPISSGTFNGQNGLVLGSMDLGRGRQPFLAGDRFVQDVAELHGQDFNLLASRSAAGGRPIGGEAWSGRFEGAWFLLCRSPQATPLKGCPAADLRRYAVSVVGTELELLFGTEALRMRAFRTEQGHVLFLAMKDAASQQEQVWLGLPAALPSAGSSLDDNFGETSLRSNTGISEVISLGTRLSPTGALVLTGISGHMPLAHLFYIRAGNCSPDLRGELPPSALAGMFQGSVDVFSCGNKSGEGPVFFVQGAGVKALLGATGGPLAGRWALTLPPPRY